MNKLIDQDPFADQASYGLFFAGAERKRIADSLVHSVSFGTAPIVLTGAVGSGKSTVVAEVVRNLEANVEVVTVTAELMMTLSQLLTTVLGARKTDDGDLLFQLESWVQESQQRSRKILIIIDDIQDLTSEVLNSIFQIFQALLGKVNMLYVGDRQAKELLDDCAEREQALLNCVELPAPNKMQIADYIRYRLKAAGWPTEFPISDLQLEAVYRRSHGSFSNINNQVREMLSDVALSSDQSKATRRFPFKHALGLVLLFISMLYLGLNWRENGEQPRLNESQGDLIIDSADSHEVQHVNKETVPSSERVNLVDSAHDQHKANNKTDSDIASIREKIGAAESVKKDFDAVDDQHTAESVVVETASAALARRGTEQLKENSEASSSKAAASNGNAIISGETLVDTVVGEDEGQFLEEAADLASIVGSDSRHVAQPSEAEGDITSIIKRWPSNGYALQLFGTHNQARVQALVEEYRSIDTLYFYQSTHNGKPWFVLIQGPFADKSRAQSGIDILPDRLRKLRPWPRNIASIKADLLRNR